MPTLQRATKMKPLHIDGSQGEAGGQIIRTALALSTLTGKAFTLDKIRYNRPKRGLKAQHLTCVTALQQLCNAEVKGASIGSETLTFVPQKVNIPKELHLDIGTAGSITLLLQAVLPVIIFSKQKCSLHLKGGTDVAWSPPIDYVKHVLFPLLQPLAKIETTIETRGCYPRGGGKVVFQVTPKPKQPFNFSEKGNFRFIQGNCFVSKELSQKKIKNSQG